MDVLATARRDLTSGGEVLLAMLRSIDPKVARWRPEPGKWSALEIANHLADEEREDFRARLRRTLEDPEAAWEPIDPEGWVTSRKYQERELQASIDRFAEERDESLRWLSQLDEPDWQLAHLTSIGVPLTAGDLLASWVAHDLFHVRQLVRYRYSYLKEAYPGYDPSYAGDWD